jgi:hypothetical protein
MLQMICILTSSSLLLSCDPILMSTLTDVYLQDLNTDLIPLVQV